MSKIKEAIEEIEQLIEWASYPGAAEEHGNKAIAFLRPLLVEQCNICKGSREVWDVQEFGAREVGDKIPCPNCQAEEPETGELSSMLREYMEHDNLMPATILKNVANCLDRQSAEIKKLKEKQDAH